MPNTTTSPNMGIVVPVPLVEIGPAWANEVATAFNATVDAHDHSSGKGVKVTPTGLNINADLTFGSFNATALRSTRYTSQGAPLALGTDIGCTYVANGELYYNDLSSRQVKLTNVGALNTTITYFPERTPAISGTFTILSTDTFALYYVDTSGGAATVNLPASSGVTVGRTYIFVDIKRNAAVNNITFVPNGTDHINTLAANLVITQSGSYTMLTTDAAGNWYSDTSGGVLFDPLNIASNLQWVAAQTNPELTQAGVGPPGAAAQAITVVPQGANATNGTPGNFGFNLANPTGSGALPFFFGQQGGTQFFRVGKGGANSNHYSIWLGDGTGGGSAPTDWCLSNQAASALSVNGPSGGIHFSISGGNDVFFLGQGVQFGNVSVAVASGTVTLTAAQYAFPYILLTGSLTANVTLVFPGGTGATWIIDATAVVLNAHTITAQANANSWGTTIGVANLYMVTYGGTGRLYGMTLTP